MKVNYNFSLPVLVAANIWSNTSTNTTLTLDSGRPCSVEKFAAGGRQAPVSRVDRLTDLDVRLSRKHSNLAHKIKTAISSSSAEWISLVAVSGMTNLLLDKPQAGYAFATLAQTTLLNTVQKFLISSEDALSDRALVIQRVAADLLLEAPLETIGDELSASVGKADVLVQRCLEEKDFEKAEKWLYHRQGLLLSWPTQVKPLVEASTELNELGLPTKISMLLGSRPEEERLSLESIIWQIVANGQGEEGQRVQLFLQGPAGVGKTRFARQIATALDLPIYSVRLGKPSFFYDSMAKLTGNQQDLLSMSNRYLEVPSDPCEILGAVGCGFLQTQVINPIIFFDEASEVLNDPLMTSALKELLDPQARTLRIKALGGAHIDISRATFVFAGNEPILDRALRSRLTTLTFGAIDRSNREKVLDEAVEEFVESRLFSESSSKQLLVAMLNAAKAEILAVDLKAAHPGVRILIGAVKHVGYLALARARQGRALGTEELSIIVFRFYKEHDAADS